MERLKKQIIPNPEIRYSESFKLKIVKDVEDGIISKEEARRKYGIKGHSTVLKWCKKYGRYQHIIIKKELKEVKDHPKESRKTQKDWLDLERKLKETELKVIALETVIEIANEEYSTDLKKKFGSRR